MSDAYDRDNRLDTATNTTKYPDYPGSLGSNEVEKLKLEIIKLKARLYDFEHDADRSVK